jgi:hypothetical protein
MPSLKIVLRAALLASVAACTADGGSPLAPTPGGPAEQLSDAAHGGAVPGFYFLPPVVPAPSFSGSFDAALAPRAEICVLSGTSCGAVIAQYTTTTGAGGEVVRVDAAQQSYAFNWRTDQFNLDVAKHYRISVFVGAVRLGFADVDPVASGKELKNVDTQQYIPLLDGRTLPVKFRVEKGIVGALDVEPDSATVPTGGTQQFTATATDLHGDPVAATVVWSSSDTLVARIGATGVALGVAPGSATITARSGGASATATVRVLNPNTPPVAVADSFAAIGNVTVPVAAPGVLGNDTDAEGTQLSAVPGTIATTAGGTVTMAADGGFTYLSAPGFTGADSFTYQATDGQATASAQVQLTVDSRVWYVANTAAAPGDGRDASPFATLKAAEAASTAGETIFVLAGNGGSAGYDEGLVLKPSQMLTGQGVPANVTTELNGSTVVLLAAGTAPQITRSTAGTTVLLATGNTVQGVDVASTAGAAIRGSAFGTFTAAAVSVQAAGGPALDLQGGNAGASFSVLSSDASAGAGVRLTGVQGVVSAAAGRIAGAAGAGVEVDGGAGDVTIGAEVVNAAGHVVSVMHRTGGTVTLAGDLLASAAGIRVAENTGGTIAFTGGSKVLNTGAGDAVALADNPGANVRLAGGGLSLTTTTGTAFLATGGGTVTVTGSNNAIGSAGGVALRIAGTTIGASGLTFRSITATGGSNGIVLDHTGAGGLQVTGTGAPGSGGTLEGTVGADGTTGGAGVRLDHTGRVELSYMTLANHSNYAIRGTTVNGFELAGTRVEGSNGTNEAAPYFEGSISFEELTGSALITGSSISGGRLNNLRVVNTGGTLDRLTLSGDTLGANGPTGLQSVLVQPQGSAVMRVTVQNTRFTASRDQLFMLNMLGSPTADLVFTGNTLGNNHPAVLSGGGSVLLAASGGAGAVPTLSYQVTGNIFRDADGSALVVNKGIAGGSFSGTISGNVVGAAAIANSGSRSGSAINILAIGRGSHTVAVTGNQLYQYNNFGILLQAGGAAKSGTGFTEHDAALNATVTGNTIGNPGTFGALPGNGIQVNAGTNSNAGSGTPDAYAVCAHIAGNSLTGSGVAGGADFSLRQRFATTVRLPGYAGGAFDNAAAAAFVQANNGGAAGTASSTSASGGGGFVGGSACATP